MNNAYFQKDVFTTPYATIGEVSLGDRVKATFDAIKGKDNIVYKRSIRKITKLPHVNLNREDIKIPEKFDRTLLSNLFGTLKNYIMQQPTVPRNTK